MKTLITILALLAFYGTAHAEDPPPPNDIIIKTGLNDTPALGRAYDSRSQNFKGSCVRDAGGSQALNSLGSLDARLESDANDSASSLGIQAGGRYRTGVTEISASAQLAQSTISSGYSVNFTYKFDSSYNEQFLLDGNNQMDVAPNFAGLLTNQRGFFLSCGDEYVSSLLRAARLLVNLSVSFSSQEEAQSFAASFALNSPTVGVTAGLQEASSHVSKKTTMKFYSVQVGGTPGFAGKAICPDNIEGKANSSNNCAEPIIQCGFGQFDDCINLLEGIVKYSANDFSKQVTDDKGAPKNFSIVSVHAQPYAFAGGQFPLPPGKEEEATFQEELKTLQGQFEGYFNSWVLANRLTYSGAPRLSAREAKEMIDIEGGLHKVVNGLVIKIEDCYKFGYDKCHENSLGSASSIEVALADMKKKFENLQDITQASDFNAVLTSLAQPETLAQYCDLADENNRPIQTTIDSLKAWANDRETKAKTGKTFDKGDECANYEAYFKSITDLTLANDGSVDLKLAVGSLAPLTTLTNLTSLSLVGQAIQDVAPLKSLVSLKRLKLDHDMIGNICSLSALKHLQELSVRGNQITTLDCLSEAPKLALLDGRDNSSQLNCPLANAAGCKLQDFSKSATIFPRSENCGVHVGSQALSLRDGKVLVAGGTTPAYGIVPIATIDVYDQDRCTASANQLNVPRSNFTLTKLRDGRVLAAGGYTDSLEILDSTNFKSRTLSVQMKVPRSFHTATLLKDGRVLIVGGYTDTVSINYRSDASSSYEIFNPVTETIEAQGWLSIPRAEHTASLLPDGRVLIVGGYQTEHNLTSAEIIDPVANSVQTVNSPLNQGRFDHTATTLKDGRVLLAGGVNWVVATDDKGVTSWSLAGMTSLEIFDPQTQKFSLVTDQLSVGRGLMGAQLMPDGRVLLIGGNTAGRLFDPVAASPGSKENEAALATASSTIELFDPVNQGVFSVGNLGHSRSQLAVAGLNPNSLLIIGGMGSDVSLVSSELLVYEP